MTVQGRSTHNRPKKDATNVKDRRWWELYRAAMVELNPLKVAERVAAARAAMAQRQAELEKNRSKTLEERWEIAEATSNLEFWARKVNTH